MIDTDCIRPEFFAHRHLLLDCDGVLLDWTAGFGDFCIRQGFPPATAQPSEYDLSSWLAVDKDRLLELITAYNEEAPEFGSIPAYDHAVSGLRRLREEGWEMTVITSATITPARKEMRLANLARHFGKDTFRDVIFLDMGADKRDILKGFDPAPWLEDNYRNALAGHGAGHLPIVVIQTYNATEREEAHPEVLWVSGIDQAAEALISAERSLKTPLEDCL